MVVMEEAVVEGAAASEDVNLIELMNARADPTACWRVCSEEVDLADAASCRRCAFPRPRAADADEGYHQL